MLDVLLSTHTGSIVSLSSSERCFSSHLSSCMPLFSMRLLKDGQFSQLDALAAGQVTIDEKPESQSIHFSAFTGYGGLAVVARISRLNADTLAWTLEISNKTGYLIASVDYPCLTVADDLQDCGGESAIFYPRVEGVELTSVVKRDPDTEAVDLNREFQSMYPGHMPMQFMGYYNGREGLYFASHDIFGTPKVIEAYATDFGIRLGFRACHAITPMSEFKQPYPVITSLAGGSWYDCAELYREFIEISGMELPRKLYQNETLPEWYHRSPVVVIFPPRSIRGTGYTGPNEFFPYVNSMKYLDELAEQFQTPILSLLTYWEGSAPWCPPFNWPPYGGEEVFHEFLAAMHERGFFVGLYGSGLNWTDKSLLCPEFDKTDYRIENDLIQSMCRWPDGSHCAVHYPGIRDGYRMCVACDETRRFAREQIEKMAEAGVDFIQYFDQDHGGLSWPCYADDHPHPAGYGRWATESMRKLYKDINASIGKKNPDCVIGTEQSASEYFISDLPFNDRRAISAYRLGRPVPAYEYVFHEYANSFLVS